MKTQTGNPTLIKLIQDEIKNRGPVSFAWFMEQALYHPEHGYYSSGRCAIGRKGDYFTNVSIGPLFGQLMMAQFAEIWEQLGKIDNFVIVEQGAHDGQFARDVLQSAQSRAPEFFEALDYRIIEPFPILRERQSRMLEPFRNKIEWRNSLEPFTGVHFSNELLDAMPVRLIIHGMEKLVGLQGDRLAFIEGSLSNTASDQAALDWIDSLAANLKRGYAIVIDYGHSGDEFQRGIQVRAQHRHLDSPFEQIGHADITMHVDWTSIARRAEADGLRVAGFTDQHHFLTGIISEPGDWDQSSVADSPKAKRALQTLLHPEMLGRAFQVLALAKNVDPTEPPPAGFKFAREPHSVLGLGNPN
ncbi:MAG TPA: SAM-dependent methyltransferase [Candidatus Binatia bacterium]|nr:SAM-dependent methyltransferase [Candidatus Binatia bacterium]